jgi:osmoprotectant transport system substrate-binding protein
LAAYLGRSGPFKLAGCEEFVTRPDALPAFQAAYGFRLAAEQMVVLAGCNTAQTEQAAAQGTSGVNAAMAYGTDGSLAALGLAVLEDTRSVQPVYAPAPVVRGGVYARHPELADILDPIFATLDRATLQRLNAAIAVEGRDPAAVAGEHLKAVGLPR